MPKAEATTNANAHNALIMVFVSFFIFSPLIFLYFRANGKITPLFHAARVSRYISAGNQPLIPTVDTPSINCFWKIAKSAAQGTIINTPTAIVRLIGSFVCPYSKYSARERVY